MLECSRTVLYSTWIRSSSARRTAGSVIASRWGHSAFRVPFNDSIQAWSVGVDGLPQQVSVQRSSGFARLDDQAMSAMKRARFKPQTDQGVPIEWIVIAPLQYEIE